MQNSDQGPISVESVSGHQTAILTPQEAATDAIEQLMSSRGDLRERLRSDHDAENNADTLPQVATVDSVIAALDQVRNSTDNSLNTAQKDLRDVLTRTNKSAIPDELMSVIEVAAGKGLATSLSA